MPREDQGPKTAGDCGPCSPAARNRYFRGKLLTVADYRIEQSYAIQRRRMVNRSVLGWGVVAGFPLSTHAGGGVAVGRGIALDRHGRELVGCEEVVLAGQDDVLWLQRGTDGCVKAGAKPAARRYRLDVHYAECLIDGVRVDEGCGQSACEWNHVCETVVFALWPDDTGQRPDCMDPRYPPGDCACSGPTQPVQGDTAYPVAVDDRGPHETLCRWSLEWRGDKDFDPCRPAGVGKGGRGVLGPRAGGGPGLRVGGGQCGGRPGMEGGGAGRGGR